MIEFELNNHEYITLNSLLKLLHLVQSGGEANQRIENGEVMVNGVVEKQKRKKLYFGNEILFMNKKVLIK